MPMMSSAQAEVVSPCPQFQALSSSAHEVTLERIRAATTAIGPHLQMTPVEISEPLSSEGRRVHFKLENFQTSGSFKPRGSLWRLHELSAEQRRLGVVASTAGNHGVGLSYAGKMLGIAVDIYLPRSADPTKLRMIRENGAKVTFFASVEEAREAAMATAQQTGKTFVSAYNDPFMAEGGGSVGIELLDQVDQIDTLIIPLGGGGFAAGVSMAVRSKFPNAKIYAVQSANSPKMARWIQEGREHEVDLSPSIAEGLTVNMEADTITFPYLQRLLDGVILVSEAEIAESVVWALDTHQWWVEPSGAAAIAAIRHLPDEANRGNIVSILTGRNMSVERFDQIRGQLRGGN